MPNTSIQRAAQQQAARQNGPPTIQQYIRQMEGQIARALPSVMTPERFTRITLSALSSNEKLQQTTPQSFLAAMMNAAQLGLEPNTPLGQAYLIPYGRQCQFQIGYRGMIDLAYRGGAAIVDAKTIYENDDFKCSFGLEPELRLTPAKGDRGKPIAFYGMFKTKDGGYGYEVMTVEEVRDHARRFSKAYNNGPWKTNFEEMAKKTVLKKVLKYAPLKSDFFRAVAQDETVKTEINEDMYMVPPVALENDNVQDAEFVELSPHEGGNDASPPPQTETQAALFGVDVDDPELPWNSGN